MSEVKLSVHEAVIGNNYKLNIVNVREDREYPKWMSGIDFKSYSYYLKELARNKNEKINVVYSDAYDAIFYFINRDYKVKIQLSSRDIMLLNKFNFDTPAENIITTLLMYYTNFFINHEDGVIIPNNGEFTYYLETSYNIPETTVTKRYNQNEWVKSEPITIDPLICMDNNYITNAIQVLAKKSEENYYLHQTELFRLLRKGEIQSPTFIRISMELTNIDPNSFYMDFKIYRVFNVVIFLRSRSIDYKFLQTQDELNNPEKYLIKKRKEVSNRISGLKHLVTVNTFKNSDEESEFIIGDLKRNVADLMSTIKEYEEELKTVKDRK